MAERHLRFHNPTRARGTRRAWFPHEIHFHLQTSTEDDDMLVSRAYHHLVGYLMQSIPSDEGDSRHYLEPAGTVFFTEYPGNGSKPTNLDNCYAVTCRHVIEGLMSAGRSVILRINKPNGIGVDYAVNLSEWELSDIADVAVLPFRLPDDKIYWGYPMERNPPSMSDGQDVFFVGMFSSVPGVYGVQAIVRSGTLARVMSSVPLAISPGTRIESVVHLVEMHSWGGESGSPVFMYNSQWGLEPTYAWNPGYAEPGHSSRPYLLGMLHGQFEITRDVYKKNKRVGTVDVNSGIGAVVPYGNILHLLRKVHGAR